MSLLESAHRLILNVFLESANEKAFDIFPIVFDVLLGVVVRIRDSGRIEHVHQRSKRPCVPIMRRGGKHDQRIASAGQKIRQAGTLRIAVSALCHIVRFVDHNDIPSGTFQINAVFAVAFNGIDGNNRLVIIMKRIVIAREITPDPLDLCGIQTNQRDGKAFPQFFLKLRHHALDRDHKNAAALSTRNQFTDQNAGFYCLSQTNAVRHQNALTRTSQTDCGRFQLIWHHVHDRVMANVEFVVCRNFLPPLAFQEKP